MRGAENGEGQARAAPWARHVSGLMRGKIDLFGLDTLLNMAAAAGPQVEMRIAEVACADGLPRKEKVPDRVTRARGARAASGGPRPEHGIAQSG
jgi:hypothetical protein